MSIIQGTSKAGGGYTIDQSIRFNDDDTPYMQRTPSSAGNDNTWTFSCWIKRGSDIGSVNTQEGVIGAGDGGGSPARYDAFNFYNDTIQFSTFNGLVTSIYTSAVFRDPSAWYHVVIRYDDTQATAADRVRIYVNGVVQALNSPTYPSQNHGSNFNTTYLQRIGANAVATNRGIDGYLSEIIMVDGQSLDPTSFGEVNSDTGQWVPIAYTGSYGTNGFYITGADSADLGADYSGNSNDFTSSGLTSADQVTDTPTDNYAVLSPIDKTSDTTLSEGNRKAVGPTADSTYPGVRATVGISPGEKIYWEVDPNTLAGIFGVATNAASLSQSGFADIYGWQIYTGSSTIGTYENGSTADSGDTAWTTSQIVGIEIDRVNNVGKVYVNGTYASNADITLPSDGFLFPVIKDNSTTGGAAFTFNCEYLFPESDWSYTPSTDFKALSVNNLPDPTIALPTDHFQTVLDTGANIKTTAEALYTDQFEWIKDRDNANNHQLIDSVRGTSAVLQSNSTGAETTYSAPSGNSVAWVWKANGSGSSNTDGSVTSTVSANQTAGFSIATFQKPAADTNETVGHGLGTTPAVTILRWRSGTGGPPSWYVWHQSFSSVGFLRLQGTDTFIADTTVFSSAPSSTVVNTGTAVDSDTDTTEFVMYNFAEVEGFSKFGSYTGNASTNGPFVYCGFRPSWVLIKQATTSARDWIIQDATRNTYNVANLQLLPNTSQAEATTFFSQSAEIDILSNGFKVRSSAARVSESGATYIFMAFAESPFKTANAR